MIKAFVVGVAPGLYGLGGITEVAAQPASRAAAPAPGLFGLAIRMALIHGAPAGT